MTRLPRLFLMLAAAITIVGGIARADSGAPVSLEVGVSSPHALVIRHQGWAESLLTGGINWIPSGTSADFAVIPAEEALARRAAGEPLKAVYVVSREAGEYRLLVVREDVLRGRADLVAQVVGLYERARKWLVAHPLEAATLVAQAAGLGAAEARNLPRNLLASRQFLVSRPGPALAQSLKSAADPSRAAHVDALLDDGPMRAASRALESGPKTLLLSQR